MEIAQVSKCPHVGKKKYSQLPWWWRGRDNANQTKHLISREKPGWEGMVRGSWWAAGGGTRPWGLAGAVGRVERKPRHLLVFTPSWKAVEFVAAFVMRVVGVTNEKHDAAGRVRLWLLNKFSCGIIYKRSQNV